MNKPKRLRRRCAAEDCRKVFRHVDQRAAFCSLACKQRVYRARKKAAAQVEQEQNQAWADATAAAMIQAQAERERQVESNRPGRACTTPPHGPTSARAYPLAIHPHIASRAQAPDGADPLPSAEHDPALVVTNRLSSETPPILY